MTSAAMHWDNAYRRGPVEETGWFEREPTASLELIAATGVAKDAAILDVGAGASTLMDHLLDAGYRSLTACDISQVAIDLLRDRLGGRAEAVRFVAGDVLEPATAQAIGSVVLWHDRAMFHFLTHASDRERYVATLRSCVEAGGWVILATFAPDGAEMCSGLPVRRYDAAGLEVELGDGFEMVTSRSLVYTQPSGGLRPFTYALFRRA